MNVRCARLASGAAAAAGLVVLVACSGVPEDKGVAPEPERTGARSTLALAPLPDVRHGHRAEVLGDGRVLVFGGFESGDTSATRGANASWLFEPDHEPVRGHGRGAWRRTGDLAVPLAFHASAVHDGVVYAVGEDRLQRFEAASETWHVVLFDERLPSTHAGAAVVDGVLYAVGFESVAVDLATLAVSALPTPPDHHDQDHFSYVVELNGRLHLFGGFAGADFQPRTRHVVFDGTSWSHASPLPFEDAAKFGVGVAHDERFVLIGMHGNAVYDARTDSWELLPPPPWDGFRCMAAAFVLGSDLHVLGGLGADRTHGHDVFDLAERVWNAAAETPTAARTAG